jgi:hypothetical protein
METLITHEIERKRDGQKIVRNYFINKSKGNLMALAHSYFTKDERKQAKLNHKT